MWKDGEQSATLKRNTNGLIFENHEVKAQVDPSTYSVVVLDIKTDSNNWLTLRQAQEMSILFQAVKEYLALFSI